LEKYLVLRHSFTKSHNLSIWTNHLFHQYNWCHVIDTVVQLCITVGLGIKLKSMSVRSWKWTSLCLPRNSHIAARVLLKQTCKWCRGFWAIKQITKSFQAKLRTLTQKIKLVFFFKSI